MVDMESHRVLDTDVDGKAPFELLGLGTQGQPARSNDVTHSSDVLVVEVRSRHGQAKLHLLA